MRNSERNKKGLDKKVLIPDSKQKSKKIISILKWETLFWYELLYKVWWYIRIWNTLWISSIGKWREFLTKREITHKEMTTRIITSITTLIADYYLLDGGTDIANDVSVLWQQTETVKEFLIETLQTRGVEKLCISTIAWIWWRIVFWYEAINYRKDVEEKLKKYTKVHAIHSLLQKITTFWEKR